MRSLLTGLLVLLASLSLQARADADGTGLQHRVEGASWVYTTRGRFDEVRADLVYAIESRGLVVSYQAYTGSMLQRTSKAVGAMVRTYDFADTLLFCSAELTHQLTAANPHNITLCPYSISVYTLISDPTLVHLAIRSPENGVPAYQDIHTLLVEIIDDTVNW